MSADPPPRSPSAAKERCRGGRDHRWVRVYQGATVDAYKCENVGCGQNKTTEGTATRGR